jgi:hypothetical protein
MTDYTPTPITPPRDPDQPGPDTDGWGRRLLVPRTCLTAAEITARRECPTCERDVAAFWTLCPHCEASLT